MSPEPLNERKGASQLEASLRVYQPLLLALAKRLTGGGSDAQDLVQDTFERALRHAHSFDPKGSPRAWLIGILHNLFVDACRRKHADPLVLQDLDALAQVPATVSEAVPGWSSITQQQVDGALEQLGPEYSVVYQLHAYEGHSYKAISQKLQIAVATVGTRLLRARQKLQALLAPLVIPDEEGL